MTLVASRAVKKSEISKDTWIFREGDSMYVQLVGEE